MSAPSKWSRLPLPCRTCGQQDEREYRILRDRDGTVFCLHVDCPGDWGRRHSRRLPHPCAICHTSKPGAFTVSSEVPAAFNGNRHTRRDLLVKCVHLKCLSVAWLRSGLVDGSQE